MSVCMCVCACVCVCMCACVCVHVWRRWWLRLRALTWRAAPTRTRCMSACRRWLSVATTSPQTAARGWCTPHRGTGKRIIRCARPQRVGSRARGRVVLATHTVCGAAQAHGTSVAVLVLHHVLPPHRCALLVPCHVHAMFMPSHRQQVGLKYGLPLLSPVDDAGHFTDEAGERFAGACWCVCVCVCARCAACRV
jgi:hypothetical protein